VLGYLTVEPEGEASARGDVQCGIPGFDHPGAEMHGDVLWSTDPALRCEVRGRRNASFATDFDYSSVNTGRGEIDGQSSCVRPSLSTRPLASLRGQLTLNTRYSTPPPANRWPSARKRLVVIQL